MKALINGNVLAFDDIGAGPAVLLIHDFPFSRRLWEPQVGPLVDAGFRVILPDLRGFGESAVAEDGYDMNTFADDVVALMNYLGIGRAVVGGLSMGGYVLLNLLERYRHRIAAAGFFATRCRADDRAEKARRLEMAARVERGEVTAVLEELSGLCFDAAEAGRRDRQHPEVLESMRNVAPRALAGGLEAMAVRRDYTALVRTFDLPTLVIGAERDHCVAPEHSRFLASALPNSTSRLIAGAGHLVNRERPGEFTGCLLRFLRRLVAEKQRSSVFRQVA